MDWTIRYQPQHWGGRRLAYPHVPRDHAKFARSVAVGNVVFLAGCVGWDADGGGPPPTAVEDQVVLALENARRAMEGAGSALDNVVKTFFFVRSLDDYAAVRRAETEYYERHAPRLVEEPPAATLIVVCSLARPELLVEYEAIGVLDRAAPGWEVAYYPEYWGGRKLAYPHVPKEHPKFARTEVVGNLVFVSGCQALDHDTVRVETDDFAEQTQIVLRKLKVGMEETGGSLANLVKTTVLLRDIGDLARYREVERAFFAEHAPELLAHPPASTVLHALSLPRPEFLVEVEAVGVVDREASGWPMRCSPGVDGAAGAVAAGRLVFASGCNAADPRTGEVHGGVDEQVAAALDALRAALEGAGGSLEGVVKTLVAVERLEDAPALRAAELAYFERHAPRLVSHPPASTFIVLPSLGRPGVRYQIDAVATL